MREVIGLKEKPIVKELEKKLGDLIPIKHFLITAFSRNAFFLLIKAYGWEKPAEIIIPAYTCPVIKHTVEAANAIPVPVDAEAAGLNIDPDLIVKAITENTRAIYVVHTYGTPAQIQRICSIAREYDLIVIEDLAHSLFTTYQGKQLGTYGDYAILSFTKQIVDFEGGAIATNHTAIYRKMMELRDQYQQEGRFSSNWLIESYVRIVGSWWESSFSRSALCFMLLNDWINKIVYKGSYGIRIDPSKFYASSMGSRLALLQLERLYEKKRKMCAEWHDTGHLPGEIIKDASFVSPYDTRLVSNLDIFARNLSFRTWRNPYEIPLYPRSDCLYRQLRIFSRSKFHFREAPKVIPEVE